MTNLATELQDINDRLEQLLDDEDAGITSDTGAEIDQISVRLTQIIKALTPPLDKEEIAAILAALRLYQLALERQDVPPMIQDIATDGSTITALDADAIDALCEHINLEPELRLPSRLRGPTPEPTDIVIYQIETPDGIAGYTLEPAPGNAEQEHRHVPIDPLNPGADLTLYAFDSHQQALAFVEGLMLCNSDNYGQVTKTFSPDLTAVLLENYDSTGKGLTIDTDYLRSSTAPDTEHDDALDAPYRDAAKRLFHKGGELEIDPDAKVSRGEDPGAYVQAWLWVDEAFTKQLEDGGTL